MTEGCGARREYTHLEGSETAWVVGTVLGWPKSSLGFLRKNQLNITHSFIIGGEVIYIIRRAIS